MYPLSALVTKLDFFGPVLFKQPRIGQHGRIFYIDKSRPTDLDADKKLKEQMTNNEIKGLLFKIKCAPRITIGGRVLCTASLGEFPQFINIISGEMIHEGAKPSSKSEVDRYGPGATAGSPGAGNHRTLAGLSSK